MSTGTQPFSLYRFLFQSLDPVHVGVGGYRLGRVDLPIAREPGTNLPKIPGTGISGAARHYAALQAGRLQCAGQGAGGDESQEKDYEGRGQRKGHCGEPDKCPICYTFGTLKPEAVAGRVRIFDARLILFPVATFRGPVWVTSPRTLEDFGLERVPAPPSGKVRVAAELLELLKDSGKSQPLNLGWLMVDVEEKPLELPVASGGSPGATPCPTAPEAAAAVELFGGLPKHVRERLVLVSDDLFSTVVNSNLEVRTSVSIDPETGAAMEGALFTYEALPRGTFLWLDVVVENKVTANGKNESPFHGGTGWPVAGSEDAKKATIPPGSWKSSLDVVVAGFKYFEFLGVGGMATRGFGRLKQLACREVTLQW